MSATLVRLRKRAAEFEQKKQFDRALEVYVQILGEGKDLDDEDVPLFNRVGDMLMRKGSVTDALGYYERAVDVYAERGYLNNAIALCSKILRQSPGRAAVYYKLARISARKGFRSDARKNFLEYADRMQKSGQSDEAFRALKEFASLYPDQDDVRLILAELLSKENRKGEALEQLQSLYEKLQAEGRAAEARATVDRMRAIDPSVTPLQGTAPLTPVVGDLVFLDLSDTETRPVTPRKEVTPQPVSARAPSPAPVPALSGLDITFLPDDDDVTPPDELRAAVAGQEFADVEPERDTGVTELEVPQADLTPEIADSTFESGSPARPSPEDVQAIEPGDLATVSPSPLERIEQEIEDLAPVVQPPAASTPRAVTPLSSYEFADIELDEVRAQQEERTHDLTLPLALPETLEGEQESESTATPNEQELASTTSFESVAAAEDARAAAEEAADIVADIATRNATQQPLPSDWSPPPQPPTPDEMVASLAAAGSAEDDEPLGTARTQESSGIPDDFLSRPPTFGESGNSTEEHAFPPLAGLEEAGSRTPADEPAASPSPVVSALTPRGTISIGSAESHLRSRLELDPENWDLHRQLGEALLDGGDRDNGLYEFELAMTGFELRGDLDRAQEVVDEILSVMPGSVAHHQKRVEFAVRSRDRSRLAHSYLELADALFRTGAADKAISVYSRVLELDRDNERAEFALVTLAPDQLIRLRGGPVRPDRWTDELDAIGHGEAGAPVDAPGTQASDDGHNAAPPPAADQPSADEPEAASPAAPIPAHGERVRFASIELPVPDWGEGTPTRSVAQAGEPPTAEEPAPHERLEPVSVAEETDEPGEDMAPAADQTEALPNATATPVSALRSFTPPSRPRTPAPVPESRTPTPWSVPVPEAPTPFGGDDSGYVDLGEWLRNTEPARSTRMQVEDPRPTGDEQADFEEMLRRFKRGVAANVEAEDYDAHYDLGVAYKEMGLVDEAIAQFQRALKGPSQRVRSYEALGHCFVEKKQYPIAAALLQRATEVPGSDDQQLVGVLYLLGLAIEHMGRPEEALPYYLRVFAVDIEFRDIAERVAALGNSAK